MTFLDFFVDFSRKNVKIFIIKISDTHKTDIEEEMKHAADSDNDQDASDVLLSPDLLIGLLLLRNKM